MADTLPTTYDVYVATKPRLLIYQFFIMEFGTLTKITDLHSVWENEAADFTPWLVEEKNLKLLSEAIGVQISVIETESKVGNFSADVFAVEEGTENKIIIENQLENTNHDHLGKLITYASGKGASIVIWIVKRARSEHRQAIEWLNNHTDEETAFFLVEIELYKIGDSLIAPNFNVVEQPNEWLKSMKAQDSMKPADKIKLAFWTAFKEYCLERPNFNFSLRKPATHHWYNFAIGKGDFYIQLTANTQKKIISAGLLIKDDKELYNTLRDNEKEIESILGLKPKFSEANKESRMQVSQNKIDFEHPEKWDEYFNWFVSLLPKLKIVADKFYD